MYPALCSVILRIGTICSRLEKGRRSGVTVVEGIMCSPLVLRIHFPCKLMFALIYITTSRIDMITTKTTVLENASW